MTLLLRDQELVGGAMQDAQREGLDGILDTNCHFVDVAISAILALRLLFSIFGFRLFIMALSRVFSALIVGLLYGYKGLGMGSAGGFSLAFCVGFFLGSPCAGYKLA